MTDKRTGKKKKKIRPVVTEDTGSSISQVPIIPPKKSKKPYKGK